MSQVLPPHVAEAGIAALKTGWLTMGPRTQQLEAALRERFGVEHAVATSSGTAALHLALLAVGIERGGAVVVPDPSPPSCTGAVEAVGALPVRHAVSGFDLDAGVLDGEGVAGAGAIIARHHLGYPADLGGLAEACGTRGVALVEDCRDALGAVTSAGPVGGLGSAAVLSFSSRRAISCGEGGAVLTAHADVADRVRSLRSHAMTSGSWDRHRGHAETYDVVDVGFNYRIDEVRAAMLEAALADLDDRVAERRRQAGSIAASGRAAGAEVPSEELIARASPEAVPMRVASGTDRADLVVSLAADGVEAGPFGDGRLVIAALEGSRR